MSELVFIFSLSAKVDKALFWFWIQNSCTAKKCVLGSFSCRCLKPPSQINITLKGSCLQGNIELGRV